MSNISNIPLEDWFSTSLTRSWDWSVWTIYVASTPSFTFPSWITTYIVVNPWKSNMQLATINAYNSSLKTMTVSSITLNKWASVASTANPHSVWSKVIISDNYQFWADIISSLNSKVDWDTQPFPSYTTSWRDALTASNWMVIYNSTTWELNQYISWSWSAISAWSTQPNASLTVAGKVELSTDSEITAWTATWWTWASLVITPEQQKKSISLKWAWTTFWDTDEIVVNISWVDYRITWANLRESIAASTANKGTVEMATDAEVTTWTDETRYVNPKQIKNNTNTVSYTGTFWTTWTTSITHWLWRIPKRIDVFTVFNTSSQFPSNSWGNYCLSWNFCIAKSNTTWWLISGYCIFEDVNWDISDSYGLINNVWTTTFDLVYTQSTGGGTAKVLFIIS